MQIQEIKATLVVYTFMSATIPRYMVLQIFRLKRAVDINNLSVGLRRAMMTYRFRVYASELEPKTQSR